MKAPILRAGDILRVFKSDDDLALLRPKASGAGALTPWPARFFTPGDSAATFDYHVPVDFAEKAASEGRIFPADAWSTWPEASA